MCMNATTSVLYIYILRCTGQLFLFELGLLQVKMCIQEDKFNWLLCHFFQCGFKEDNFWTEIFYFWRSICDICSHTLEVGYLVSEPHCCSTLQVTKPWMERRHVMSTHSPLRLHPDSILPQNRLLTQQSAAICVVWSARWQAQHFVSDYLGPHFVFTQTQLPVNAGFEVVVLSLSL